MAAAWYDARAAAKQFKAPILAFVLPEASLAADEKAVAGTIAAEQKASMLATMMGSFAPKMQTARDVMLRQVQVLRASPPGMLGNMLQATDAQMVFALTVPVFVTAKTCGAKAGENVVLIAPHGERIDGWQLDLLQGETFVKAISAHVFSEDSLTPRQANLHGPALQLLKDLRAQIEAKGEGGWSPYHTLEMQQKLAASLVALGPALVRREDGKLLSEPELGGIEQSRAPFGSKAHVDQRDPCPGCGMGYTPPALMTVLKLLGP